MNKETNPLREKLSLWILKRIEGYREYLSNHPEEAQVYNAVISELETILITQVQTATPSPAASDATLGENGDVAELLIKRFFKELSTIDRLQFFRYMGYMAVGYTPSHTTERHILLKIIENVDISAIKERLSKPEDQPVQQEKAHYEMWVANPARWVKMGCREDQGEKMLNDPNLQFAIRRVLSTPQQPAEQEEADTSKCEKCGGRTALMTGQWHYEPNDEPYLNGKTEESIAEAGNDWVGGFKCDECGHIQGLWHE